MPDHLENRPPPLRGEVLPDQPAHLPPSIALLDWISFVMDRLLPIPGTRLRWGLNALFLLLPIVGDIIPTLISVGILIAGLTNHRVPRIVATRMVLNSLLDACLGWIPLFGDLFDLYFKADTRNVRLLQEYADRTGPPPRPTWRHWVFVGCVLGLFVLVLVLIVWGTYVLLIAVRRRSSFVNSCCSDDLFGHG